MQVWEHNKKRKVLCLFLHTQEGMSGYDLYFGEGATWKHANRPCEKTATEMCEKTATEVHLLDYTKTDQKS